MDFIFVNSVKRHICDVKNSRLRPDLPTSVNTISLEFYFHETSHIFRKNKPFSKMSELTVWASPLDFCTYSKGAKTSIQH